MVVRVFIGATSLRPSYGGPAYSVSRLAMTLAEAGADVGLWDSDQSARDNAVLYGHTKVSRLTGSAEEALDGFGKPDILHDNGLWLRHNHQLAKLALQRGIPRIVSTRGMLEPWAMRHKGWKKRVAWGLYQCRDLKCASCLHTTAQREAQHVRALGLGPAVCMIPNGVDLPDLSFELAPPINKASLQKTKKTALFLGRIYPVKGLPMLIEAWKRVRPAGWVLQIAGPDEAGHRAQLEDAVSNSDLDAVVSFLGPIEGDQKQATLFDANFLVLPSHSESFGMVIAEALAHRLPVLTTTVAPWPMLQEYGCGWRVDPTVDGITEGLRQATSQKLETLQAMGATGPRTGCSRVRMGTCGQAVHSDL